LASGTKRPGHVAVERHEVQRVRIARMNGGWEPEARRQTGLDALPVLSAVVAAVHAAVVLLIKPVRNARSHDETMHALAMVGIVLPVGQEIGPRASIASFPGLASVRGIKYSPGRNPDPDLLLVPRVRNE